MKKVIFSLLAVMALGFFTSNAQAQTSPALKVGVFDYDVIVGHLPEYKDVQKKIEEFEKDSLGPEEMLSNINIIVQTVLIKQILHLKNPKQSWI
ncbi:OmpH family outer membrane protein [Arachidicoccus ginsenosidivorans]|uniref:OmpH family outer membrane protein n=1 Tax=Arachidicoccus ginsenosidivorans TaxID=496057 RepID=A0A5B8VKP7_9BACT|nr:OmpH family outer membrane protein [Arachidicoccus ginsenosidivorans]QEC72164.1 OmpH family outer membrane protein [Arachidicoccus ginsenosidivorans]